MPESQTIVDAKQLVKTYTLGKVQVPALRGVDLKIEKGEMVAIMGPSCSGKTSLLNCISGLDDITSGEVLFDGKNIHKMADNPRTAHRAKHMGFIFQFYNLMPVLTAAENAEMPLLLLGWNARKARAKVMEIFAQIGIADFANHKPAELSGGQRQRVTIARALIHSPSIIWADEPTGDLDDETTNEITDLFVKLNQEQGQTFVIVTHNTAVAQKAKRTISMHSGHITTDTQN